MGVLDRLLRNAGLRDDLVHLLIVPMSVMVPNLAWLMYDALKQLLGPGVSSRPVPYINGRDVCCKLNTDD